MILFIPCVPRHSSHVLLTKLLYFAAETAAQDALEPSSVPANHGTKLLPTTSNNNDVRSKGQSSGSGPIAADLISGAPIGGISRSMSEFRGRASRALRAARAVVEQRGLDPRDLDAVAKQLAKGWICRPKSGAGGGGLEGGDVEVGDDREDRMSVFIGGMPRGMGYRESVFMSDPREVRGWCRLGFPLVLGRRESCCVCCCVRVAACVAQSAFR